MFVRIVCVCTANSIGICRNVTWSETNGQADKAEVAVGRRCDLRASVKRRGFDSGSWPSIPDMLQPQCLSPQPQLKAFSTSVAFVVLS